jgi:hypothetical protein
MGARSVISGPGPTAPQYSAWLLLPLCVTVRQLRAFEAAYRLRNLTHAAGSLHMTQSAMSALIKQFEESLGVQLFERTPRTLKPTAAADEAYPQSVDILGRVATLQAGMKDRAKGAETLLSFSCVPSLASTVVPAVLGAPAERSRMVAPPRLRRQAMHPPAPGRTDPRRPRTERAGARLGATCAGPPRRRQPARLSSTAE